MSAESPNPESIPPRALSVLATLASAETPAEARAALKEATVALGAEAALYSNLLETMARRVNEMSRLRELAGSDELTGIPNRRVFQQALQRELARLQRGGHGPAIVLLDLDGLKELNDTHGHSVGDEAIVAAAHALSGALRPTDVVARLGGDEFAVLLPETSEGGVRSVSERIRAVVQARKVAGEFLRISVGWAVPEHVGANVETLLSFADARLYADKVRRKGGARDAPRKDSRTLAA